MSTAAPAVETQLATVIAGLSIPPCPLVLTRLLAEVNKHEPDIQRVGQLIGCDLGLAASMLKTVNSPFYGLRSKATTVQQALTLLGLLNVTHMVSGLLLRQALPTNNNPVLETYWRNSSSIAMISAHLAPLMGGIDRDEAYTFALFRDCGIPLLAARMPGYVRFMQDSKLLAAHSFTEIEDLRFSVTHTEVGRLLAEEWLLPGPIVEAVAYHHDYEALQGGQKLCARSCRLIAVALVAEWLYFRAAHRADLCYEWNKGSAFALEALQVTVPELEAQLPSVARTLASSANR